MRKSISAIAVVLMSATIAAAQETPRTEVFLGYDFTRFNSATDVPAFSANGGGGQFTYNFNRWIGFVADLGAAHNGNIGGYHLDTTVTNFLFGPRIPIRHWSRVTPYFQILWGGVYGATSAQVQIPAGTPTNPIVIPPAVQVNPLTGSSSTDFTNAVNLRAVHDQTAFAMTVGGGLDIKINKIMSFRAIGLDYYLTRLQNLRTAEDNNQHSLRYTTGINFTFGGAQ